MWLINTATLTLQSFHRCPVDSYAILSHTWGESEDELTFGEFMAGEGRHKPGFLKIKLCCEQAKKDGLQYAWVDTCCINKESSTELSEAINSMFNWYRSAKLCYAYLPRVSNQGSNSKPLKAGFLHLYDNPWFTRGWTLQELIAPKSIVFYTHDWDRIGDRSSLAQIIHIIAKIPLGILRSRTSFQSFSIAQRMSWASTRETKRLEDIAYCLIGLFDVNMPLLYGEGRTKAFKRLQEEIIRQTDDESIFAWTETDQSNLITRESGLLASHPKQFARSANIKSGRYYHGLNPHSMTPRGLMMQCRMVPVRMNTYAVFLQCERELPDLSPERICIFVCRTLDDSQYRRVSYHGAWSIGSNDCHCSEAKAVKSTIYVRDFDTLSSVPRSGLPTIHFRSELHAWRFPIYIKDKPVASKLVGKYRHMPLPQTWMPEQVTERRLSYTDLEEGVVVAFTESLLPSARFRYHLEIGFDRDFRPICTLYPTGFTLVSTRTFDMVHLLTKTERLHALSTLGKFWSNAGHECDTKEEERYKTRVGRCRICQDNLKARSGPPIAPSSLYATLLPREWYVPTMRRVEGDRIMGLKFSTSMPSLRLCQRVKIEVTFDPVGDLSWLLRVSEQQIGLSPDCRGLCPYCAFWYFFFAILLVAIYNISDSLLWPLTLKLTQHIKDVRKFGSEQPFPIWILAEGAFWWYMKIVLQFLWNNLSHPIFYTIIQAVSGVNDTRGFYSSVFGSQSPAQPMHRHSISKVWDYRSVYWRLIEGLHLP